MSKTGAPWLHPAHCALGCHQHAMRRQPLAACLNSRILSGAHLVRHGSSAPCNALRCAVLLEESQVATPLVEGAHFSAARCPHVPGAAMIFIFLPRISIFYIMTHVPGQPPRPKKRVPWPSINLVAAVDIAPSLNSLIVVAGAVAAEVRLTMKAFTIVGGEGGNMETLDLLERPCSQRVSRLQQSAEASVVYKEPAWAKLWNGDSVESAAGAQRGANLA